MITIDFLMWRFVSSNRKSYSFSNYKEKVCEVPSGMHGPCLMNPTGISISNFMFSHIYFNVYLIDKKQKMKIYLAMWSEHVPFYSTQSKK